MAILILSPSTSREWHKYSFKEPQKLSDTYDLFINIFFFFWILIILINFVLSNSVLEFLDISNQTSGGNTGSVNYQPNTLT